MSVLLAVRVQTNGAKTSHVRGVERGEYGAAADVEGPYAAACDPP